MAGWLASGLGAFIGFGVTYNTYIAVEGFAEMHGCEEMAKSLS